MKSVWIAALSVLLTMGLMIGTADAKRLGGGSSFGSKPSQSQPMSRDAVPNSAASKAAPGAAPAAMPRPGFGGMLGGLLLGGLLGGLLFGGAFDHIGLMDFVIFGLIAFLAYKFFAARRAARPAGAAAGMGMGAPMPEHAVDNSYQRAAASVASHSSGSLGGSGNMGAARPALVMPVGFKADEFLTGARRSYERLQQAWDKGELADIRELTTDKVFAEIQDQYRARQGENRTELKDVRAELLDIKEVDGQLEASVMFDTDMIEHDASAPLMPESTRVQEVWHFVRPKSSLRPTWFVDGIQQVTG